MRGMTTNWNPYIVLVGVSLLFFIVLPTNEGFLITINKSYNLSSDSINTIKDTTIKNATSILVIKSSFKKAGSLTIGSNGTITTAKSTSTTSIQDTAVLKTTHIPISIIKPSIKRAESLILRVMGSKPTTAGINTINVDVFPQREYEMTRETCNFYITITIVIVFFVVLFVVYAYQLLKCESYRYTPDDDYMEIEEPRYRKYRFRRQNEENMYVVNSME